MSLMSCWVAPSGPLMIDSMPISMLPSLAVCTALAITLLSSLHSNGFVM
jgi:hypothetical protein